MLASWFRTELWMTIRVWIKCPFFKCRFANKVFTIKSVVFSAVVWDIRIVRFYFVVLTLHNISISGLGGNPLQPDLMSIYVSPNGTQKLLTFLLDHLTGKYFFTEILFIDHAMKTLFRVYYLFTRLYHGSFFSRPHKHTHTHTHTTEHSLRPTYLHSLI